MRKKILESASDGVTARDGAWLNLEEVAAVEVTSEAEGFPIEAALLPPEGAGWRAAQPGAQTIRLRFDQPTAISQILLEIVEGEQARTQEFVLRWSADGAPPFHEIVRQQWNFSPSASRQLESYGVELRGVTLLELQIVPDISGGAAHASLARLRLA